MITGWYPMGWVAGQWYPKWWYFRPFWTALLRGAIGRPRRIREIAARLPERFEN